MGLGAARITLCASTCWPSSQARVTSVKSLSFLNFPKVFLTLSWKSFHWRQSFSDILKKKKTNNNNSNNNNNNNQIIIGEGGLPELTHLSLLAWPSVGSWVLPPHHLSTSQVSSGTSSSSNSSSSWLSFSWLLLPFLFPPPSCVAHPVNRNA